MKKYITLLIFSLLTFTGLSQDNGITYQAVIYNPNGQSLPGEDDTLSPLVETDICLKFSIMGSGLEYEETVQTTTDKFGMVNLKIGTNTQTGGSAASLQDINWDSGEKSMRVELNAVGNCNSFVQISYQTFSYVPFAYYALNEGNTSDISALEEALAENTAADAEESAAGDAADAALQEAIDANAAADAEESTAGDAADFALQAAIDANAAADAEESAAGTAADLALQAIVEGAITEATAAIIANTVAIATTQADVDQNEADSDAADAALQAIIDAAITEATAAIIANTAAIATTQADVDQNEADSDAADAAMQADIDQNEADSDAADEALQAAIDAVEDAAVTQLSELSDVLVENNSLFVGNDPSATTNVAQANVSLGLTALDEITSGDRNTAVGHNALTKAKAGVNNVAMGYNTLNNVTSGNYNVGIGNSAGSNVVGGSGNVFIGNNANTGSNQAGPANRIAIGSAANVTQNNTAVIGNDLVTGVYMNEEGQAMVYAKGITFGDDTSMETAAASAADTQAADQALQDAIDANAAADAEESAAGDAADAALQDAIDSNTAADAVESAAGDAADAALQDAIDANAAADAVESADGDAADQAIVNSLDNLDLSVAGDNGVFNVDVYSGDNSPEETLLIIGTTDEVETDGSTDNQIQIGLPDNVVITGNLTVGGEISSPTIDDILATISELSEQINTLNEQVSALELLHVPVITLIGDANIVINQSDGVDYIDAGATADDLDDGDITDQIVVAGSVDVNEAGSYQITYNVTDSDGNEATEVIREIEVVDDISPVIVIIGDNPVQHEQGTEYVDSGATASDNNDGDITENIQTENSVNSSVAGSYTVTYSVVDSSGNSHQAVRDVIVSDTTAPIITLIGDAEVNLEFGESYVDAGATATDAADGDLTDSIVVVNNVDTSSCGTYTVTFNVSDAAGNAATEVVRTVTIADDEAPVISLVGDSSVTIDYGAAYTEQGASVTDNLDEDVSVVVSGTVDSMQSGTYVITYTATDACGNSTTVTRDVIVSLPVADDFDVFSEYTGSIDQAPQQVYDVFSDPGFNFDFFYYYVYADEMLAYAYFDDDIFSGFDMTIPSPEGITQAPQSLTVTIYATYVDGAGFNYDTLQGQVNGGELGDSGISTYDFYQDGGIGNISFDIPVDASTWNADGQNNTITLHAFFMYLTWGGANGDYLNVSFNY